MANAYVEEAKHWLNRALKRSEEYTARLERGVRGISEPSGTMSREDQQREAHVTLEEAARLALRLLEKVPSVPGADATPVFTLNGARAEVEAMADRIHDAWEAETNGTPLKRALGAAEDRARESGFFLKDAAALRRTP